MNTQVKKINNPAVSVVMPFRNVENYLDMAIKSVLKQSFKDFEFIIINDASTDGSEKIVKKWARIDDRIRYISNKDREGVTRNINAGLKIARGVYIARMDGDDICLPNRFKEQVDFLKANKNISLVGTFAIEINKDGDEVGSTKKMTDTDKIKKSIFYYSPCVHPSIMFRRDLVEKIGMYNESYRYCQDIELYFRTIYSGYNISNIPLFLVKYRKYPSSSDQYRKLKAKISLRIKKEAIKNFNLKLTLIERISMYLYFFIETVMPLKIRYKLESIGRKILLR